MQPDPGILEDYLGERLGYGGPARIRERRFASQGLSDQTIVLRVTGDAGRHDDLVVRCYQAAGLLREQTDPTRHYEVLRAVGATDVPVPRTRWFDDDASIFGGPFFVMDLVAGHVPVPWSPEGRAFLEEAGRGLIGEAFIDILVSIHGLGASTPGLTSLAAPAPGTDFAAAKLAELEQLVHTHQMEPEPILEDALGWMRTHVPTAHATTLVHGDYRTGNLIYDGDRIAGVLDWEFACLGDPVLDLAWVCALSNRTESDLVCYLMPRERFLDGYAERTGRRPSEESLHFWELYHQVRHTAIWLSSAQAYAAGAATDIRLGRMAYALPGMRSMVATLLGGYE